MSDELPDYDALPVAPGLPPGSSWGVWGDHDYFGTLNLQTPERALRAVRSVRSGRWFALNLDLALPDPPLFGRPAFRHQVTGSPSGNHDDVLHDWNTQRSSQWDGFRHFAHRQHGHYGGVPDEEHGMHHWAAKGMVARGVLADVDRWRDRIGRPLVQASADPITPADLSACLAAQGSEVEVGDVLLVRTGWLTWYRGLDAPARAAHAADVRQPGLAGADMGEYLWNLHISAVAADNGSVEMYPAAPGMGLLHSAALPMLGLPLGELWDLDGLAAECAARGAYDFLLTSAPIHVRGGVASPPNAIALC
jgi:hypothetical protein